MLTNKQIRNIHNLPTQDLIHIFEEIKERLRIVSQKDYVKIMNYKHSRQNLRLDMLSGKIKSVKVGETRYPIINDR